MDYLIIAAKFGLLTFALVYGGRYVVCIVYGKSISEAHAWMMGLSVSGFVTLQWLV